MLYCYYIYNYAIKDNMWIAPFTYTPYLFYNGVMGGKKYVIS